MQRLLILVAALALLLDAPASAQRRIGSIYESDQGPIGLISNKTARKVGDIVTTEKDCHEPLEIKVAGVGKFTGKPGAFKGRKPVEVLGTISKPRQPTD